MDETYEQVGWFIVGPDGIAGGNFRKTYPKWGRAVPAFVRSSDVRTTPPSFSDNNAHTARLSTD